MNVAAELTPGRVNVLWFLPTHGDGRYLGTAVYPHLEEAYRFAELVFPLLPLTYALDRAELSVNTGPFGETIANEIRPAARKAS